MPLFKKSKLIDNINLHEDLKPILLFLSEICELPYVFVSILGSNGPIVKTEIGFNFLTIPERILLLNEDVIQYNKTLIVSDPKKKRRPFIRIFRVFLLVFLLDSRSVLKKIKLLERYVLWTIIKLKHFLPYN